MSIQEKPVPPRTTSIGVWARVGATEGLALAGRVAFIYLLVILGFLLLFSLLMGIIVEVVIYLCIALGIGLFIGVLPALVIGGMSGAVIGAVTAHRFIAPHGGLRLLVGLGTALAIAGWLTIYLMANTGDISVALLAFGIPTALYVFGCGYLAVCLPEFVETFQTKIETPVDERAYLPMES